MTQKNNRRWSQGLFGVFQHYFPPFTAEAAVAPFNDERPRFFLPIAFLSLTGSCVRDANACALPADSFRLNPFCLAAYFSVFFRLRSTVGAGRRTITVFEVGSKFGVWAKDRVRTIAVDAQKGSVVCTT